MKVEVLRGINTNNTKIKFKNNEFLTFHVILVNCKTVFNTHPQIVMFVITCVRVRLMEDVESPKTHQCKHKSHGGLFPINVTI